MKHDSARLRRALALVIAGDSPDGSPGTGCTANGGAPLRPQEHLRQTRMVRIRRTTAAGFAARISAILAALVSVRLAVKYLGSEQYGIWVTLSSVIAFLGATDLGIGSGLLTEISRESGRKTYEARSAEVVASASALYVVFSGSVGLAFFLLYPHVDWAGALNLSTMAGIRSAGPATAAVVAIFIVGMPIGVVQQVRDGLQEGYLNQLWAAAASWVGLGLIALGIALGIGLVPLLAIDTGVVVLSNLGNGIELFRYRRPDLAFRIHRVRWSTSIALLKSGCLFLGLQVAGAIAFSTDNIVAANILGASAVPQYAIPFGLFAAVGTLWGVGVTSLWPAFSEATARGDVVWVRSTLIRSLAIGAILASITGLILVLTAPFLIRVWVGDLVATNYMLLAGLAVWLVLSTVGNVVAMLLIALHQLRLQVLIAWCMAAANILLSVYLCDRFGVAGLIWGTVTAYVIFVVLPYSFILPRLLRRLCAPGVKTVAS